MAFYIEDLEKIILEGCKSPDCNHKAHDTLFLAAKCHQNGVDVSYTKGMGEVQLFCRTCKQHILTIAVASDRPAQN